jgi:hypothetical protein
MLGMEDRSYPNLKKNKKKSDSEPNLKQKACFVDKGYWYRVIKARKSYGVRV